MIEVKGFFRVNKLNEWTSNVQYAALFLDDRILFVKVGGQFVDSGLGASAVGGALVGPVGWGIGAAIDQGHRRASSKRRDEKVKRLAELSREDLLQLDKANFELLYEQVKSIKMKKTILSLSGARVGIFNIEADKKYRFNIALNQSYEDCLTVVQTVLPDRIMR